LNHGEHGENTDGDDGLIGVVLSLSTKVHQTLGPGLLESVYEEALAFELRRNGIEFERQIEIPVIYDGAKLGIGFRADIVVGKSLLLEIKAVEDLKPVHLVQVITYLKLMKLKRGYLLNFNTRLLKDGIKRVSI
jgi:GxxExxY protein